MRNATVHKEHLCRTALLAVTIALPLAGMLAQETTSPPLPEAQIHEVAARMLEKADKAACNRRDCRIVVANFVFSSGLTSQLGMELADQFSREFAAQRNASQIIDRSQLHSVLERQRIPGAALNDEKAMRWLGQAVGATSILTGTLEESGTSFELNLRLLSCLQDNAGPEESFTFSYFGSPTDLNPTEAYAQQPPSTGIFADPSIRESGKSGVIAPAASIVQIPITRIRLAG